MHLTIVVPYDNAATQTAVWANEEARINFRTEPDQAARCTIAFAAMELKQHLEQTLQESTIAFADSAPEDTDVAIELAVANPASKSTAFNLEPMENGLVIRGEGRTGVLYGAYELLRMQGWRWLYPGRGGDVTPPRRTELVLPVEPRFHRAAMDLGRGFDFEGPLKEDPELWIWMARNRLNVAIHRQGTGPLLNKLGMTFKIGGHIFEKILAPDRVMPSGRTLWEEHEAWYGLPPDGKRDKNRALRTQFCVTCPDLIDFLAEELVRRVTGDWCDADRVDVWGFDTWGNTCNCANCAALGNSTDQTLHFLSGLRSHLDAARHDGRLDHDVTLIACAYEGTATITGPENAFPDNLIAAGDMVVYYPINRCYRHTFDDPDCAINRHYHDALKSWLDRTPHMPVCIGEYYNVSKHEDLPLLFTQTMSHDIPTYQRLGATGITYMHLPMVNWAMRTITQLAYADLAWNGAQHDRDSFLQQYLEDRYGPYADDMADVYAFIEEAWLDVPDWRAWSARSILSELRRWDGRLPTTPLGSETHFETPEQTIAAGQHSLRLLEKARDLLDTVRGRERDCPTGSLTVADGVNPADVARAAAGAELEMRLGEDRRLLLYGIDTMAIMTELVRYHNALLNADEAKSEAAWEKIETGADRLDSYYIPIRFANPLPAIDSRDALTRSQTRELLRRIRAARNER